MKYIDFVEKLNLLLEALYFDAIDSGNSVVFEYDPSYPRVYAIDAHNIIKSIEYTTKSYLKILKNARVHINFKLTNYNSDTLFFSVFFRSNIEIAGTHDEELLGLAKQHAKDAGSKLIVIDKTTMVLSTYAILDKNSKNNITLKNPKINSYYAVIAYEDNEAFEILRKILKFIGIKTGSRNDYENFKKHINDGIYHPSIVFLHKKYLKNEQNIKDILLSKATKNFSIVIICDDCDALDERLQNEVIVVRQPYTYDSIIAALNLAYEQKMGGGRRKI